MGNNLKRAPSRLWKISIDVELERRNGLVSSPNFENILENIKKSVRKISLKREPCDDIPGYYRVVAVLECRNCEPIDQFHNSTTGYRAQYLSSPEDGDKANSFAVNILASLVQKRLKDRKPWHWDLAWAHASISDPSAKIWIHQGLWLRHAREVCQELIVDAWNRNRYTCNRYLKKKKRYGRILPGCENRIDFKGAWVSDNGEVISTLKPSRADSIHKHGFT